MSYERKSLLTFVEQTVFNTNNAYTRALYKCECGQMKEINMRKVRELHTISCGCMKYSGFSSTTHGMSKHPLYKVWKGIKRRCYNKNDSAYINYGGRGVVICAEWLHDGAAFVKWGLENGWQPGLEIDKDIKANEMGKESLIYSPEMCQFVSRKQNCNTRRPRRTNLLLRLNGVAKSIGQWSAEVGISSSLIRYRVLNLKWTTEDALSIRPNKKYTGRAKNVK